jgi:hypothetical protein
MKSPISFSLIPATIAALFLGAGANDAGAAAAPSVKAAPLHRVGHSGHVRGYHHPRWYGSVSYGPSWYLPWPWYGPSLSVGYWGRHVGLVIPVLPIGYTRVWVEGDPYYVADDVYYVREPRGYRIVDRPEGDHHHEEPRRDGPTPTYVKTEKSPTDELAITAQRGQSLTQQSFDRIDCERAAIRNTGYEPAAGGGAVKKAEWVKDVASCMGGKGYAVK